MLPFQFSGAGLRATNFRVALFYRETLATDGACAHFLIQERFAKAFVRTISFILTADNFKDFAANGASFLLAMPCELEFSGAGLRAKPLPILLRLEGLATKQTGLCLFLLMNAHVAALLRAKTDFADGAALKFLATNFANIFFERACRHMKLSMLRFGHELKIVDDVAGFVEIDMMNFAIVGDFAIKKFPNFAMKAFFPVNKIAVLLFFIDYAEKFLMSVVENLRCVRRRQVFHSNQLLVFYARSCYNHKTDSKSSE